MTQQTDIEKVISALTMPIIPIIKHQAVRDEALAAFKRITANCVDLGNIPTGYSFHFVRYEPDTNNFYAGVIYYKDGLPNKGASGFGKTISEAFNNAIAQIGGMK